MHYPFHPKDVSGNFHRLKISLDEAKQLIRFNNNETFAKRPFLTNFCVRLNIGHEVKL